MDESSSNGIRADRPAADEIEAPHHNGDSGPPDPDAPETAQAEPITEQPEPEASSPEPEPAEPEAEAEPTEPEPEASSPDTEPAEPEAEAEPTEPEPEATEPEHVAAEPEPEPEPEEPAPEEPAPEEPAAELEEPAPIEVPAAAAEEPSPELAAAVDEALEGVEASEPLPEWVPGDWFVVHTYAGYENKVKTNLESRVHSMNMEEKIFEVVIPMEDVMEVKSGKKQVVQRKVFPGYLLVRMDLDDDSWYVVRNTPGVTGFVGSGTKPIPLSDREVDRILARKGVEEKPKPKLEFSPADAVRVVTGPFANFQGVISEIDADRSKLKVLVNIFGRETPVELGFDQVAKI